jgi:hypothetical protein
MFSNGTETHEAITNSCSFHLTPHTRWRQGPLRRRPLILRDLRICLPSCCDPPESAFLATRNDLAAMSESTNPGPAMHPDRLKARRGKAATGLISSAFLPVLCALPLVPHLLPVTIRRERTHPVANMMRRACLQLRLLSASSTRSRSRPRSA